MPNAPAPPQPGQPAQPQQNQPPAAFPPDLQKQANELARIFVQKARDGVSPAELLAFHEAAANVLQGLASDQANPQAAQQRAAAHAQASQQQTQQARERGKPSQIHRAIDNAYPSRRGGRY